MGWISSDFLFKVFVRLIVVLTAMPIHECAPVSYTHLADRLEGGQTDLKLDFDACAVLYYDL